MTETPAVLVYIAQMFPDKKLAPLDDPWTFARFQSFNSYICSTVHVNFAHLTRGYSWADDQSSLDDMTRKAPQTMAAAFRRLERYDFAFLSEHEGDARPDTLVYLRLRDVDGIDPVSLIGHEKVMVTVDAVKKFEEMLG